jgi:hypothetical protein
MARRERLSGPHQSGKAPCHSRCFVPRNHLLCHLGCIVKETAILQWLGSVVFCQKFSATEKQSLSPREDFAVAYDLDQFIADCRNSLRADPGPAGREKVRLNLERLLSNKEFIEKYCGEKVERGLKLLYEDPELKFQILAHINDKARVSPPHDHGESWAIYGQAALYTEMTEWEREDGGSDTKHAKLKVAKKYRLTPGHAGIYQNGAIHSIDYPDRARFVRVTGTNLDNIQRVRFDLRTGEIHQMTPQVAT